jgi:hypothetical protein
MIKFFYKASNFLFWYIIYVWLYGVGQVDSENM